VLANVAKVTGQKFKKRGGAWRKGDRTNHSRRRRRIPAREGLGIDGECTHEKKVIAGEEKSIVETRRRKDRKMKKKKVTDENTESLRMGCKSKAAAAKRRKGGLLVDWW